MNVALYNILFNKSVTLDNLTDFEEKTILIENYAINQKSGSTPSTKLQLKVVGGSDNLSGCIGYFERSSYTKFAKDALYSFALSFDNIEQTYLLNNIAKDNFFYATQLSCASIFDICNIIDVTKVDATKVNVLYTHAQLNILYGQPKLLYTPIRY